METSHVSPDDAETMAAAAGVQRDWNVTDRPYPAAGIHRRFEEVAARQPDAIAVMGDDGRITYGALNRRANQLAWYLRGRGVSRDMPVGVCLARSTNLIVALLGILKAGGAYVPLESEYPAERLAFLLDDTGTALIVSDTEQAALLPTTHVPLLLLDDEADAIAAEPLQDLPDDADGEQLAYIMYTSGSTGTPKGVAVPHRGVLRLVSNQTYVTLDETEIVLAAAPAAFDASTFEIWGALLNGGRLALADADPLTVEGIAAALSRHSVTTAWLTAPLFTLVAAQRMDALRGLRQLLVGGDVVPIAAARRYLTECPGVLINGYGPTEGTTFSCCARVRTLAADAPSVAIGPPIANTQAWVLGADRQPVAVGEIGELYVGGAGVARGYWRRPALTAASYVPDPFSGTPGARLYRTGDLVRWLPTGDIEFLGRRDGQVKIRGFRVELGEIEAALCLHPRVRDAVVAARPDAAGERRLIAYAVVAEPKPNWSDLRAYLARTLPEHLLPHGIVFLDRLPLTAHGKVDRSALPDPAAERPELSRSYAAPATHAEQTLCEVWQRVLGVDQVGIDDNFFELGGDSIRCLQVVSLASERGLSLTLEQLFQHQTIRELTVVMAQSERPDLAPHAGVAPFSMISSADRLLVPADAEDAYSLTAVQAGLMFHSEYDPHYVVYAVSVTIREAFEEALFRQAIAHVIHRHPLLRTSYDMTTFSEPLQIVHRNAPVPLVVADLRALAKDERDRFLADWIEREKRTKFDWTSAPLVRFYLHRLDDESFQFTFSHSLFDGWSTAFVTTEVFRFYLSLIGGQQPPDEPPLTHYRDFVASERAALRSEECQQFWRRTLSGEPQSALPRWPAPLRASLPVRRTCTIPKAVMDGLFRLAKEVQVPIKSVFIAAHLRVLSLVTGHTDVIAGIINNGRVDGQQTEQVLGMFLNTPPLRLNLTGGTWQDLVKAVFAAEHDVRPFRRYPYAELQRQHGRHPLFEAAFNIINFHVYREFARTSGLKIGERLTSYDQTFYPLTAYFEVDAFSTDAFVHLDVNTRDLGDEQLAGIAAYYQMVLAAMATDPSARYDATALLLDAERELLLERWCETEAPLPDRSLCELFEAAASRSPQHVAVRSHGRELTYDALNRLANRVASRLVARGAGPEMLIAVCVERSVDMMVALLGILKAGAAYLPLDPTLPPDRLKYMVSDSGAQLILTQRTLKAEVEQILARSPLAHLPDGGPEAIALDTELEAAPASAEANIGRRAGPANLAYAIYTSGSTGAPKGVQITHRALTNLLCAVARELGFTEHDVLLAVTTLSFDIAALELFVPIVTGGTVVVGEKGDTAPELLQHQIERSGATVMQATPTTWRLLLESGWPGSPRLKMLSGGEPLPRDLAATLLERSAALWNMYGPTETTIWSTYAAVTSESGPVPVGRPLANTTAYVLDARLNPVPIGATGHLYLAGAGLARGYIRRPALTAERFCPNPFDAGPGSRMYVTGDLARMRPDGSIDVLGRSDQQVKIRGFRIEPGEIEAALLTHPAVRQAAVITREYGPGDVRLVACLTPADDRLPAPAELRQFLKRTLPDYMVPAAFVSLDQLPLTPNGKLDRRALLAVKLEAAAQPTPTEAPRTALEQQVARVWASVLNVPGIGAHQDFFEMGGHSLLATRVITRLRADLELPIPVTALFEAPTVAGLAAVIEALQSDDEAEVDRILQEIDALSDEQVHERLFSEPA